MIVITLVCVKMPKIMRQGSLFNDKEIRRNPIYYERITDTCCPNIKKELAHPALFMLYKPSLLKTINLVFVIVNRNTDLVLNVYKVTIINLFQKHLQRLLSLFVTFIKHFYTNHVNTILDRSPPPLDYCHGAYL